MSDPIVGSLGTLGQCQEESSWVRRCSETPVLGASQGRLLEAGYRLSPAQEGRHLGFTPSYSLRAGMQALDAPLYTL